MDTYFKGLNNKVLDRQLVNYGTLLKVVDESTLTDLATAIAQELGVIYNEENMCELQGYLADFVNNEISKRTLYHCIIGGCDKYSNDVPHDVVRISAMILSSVYGMDEEDDATDDVKEGCDCANCDNKECANRGAKDVDQYDIPTIMEAIIEGKTDIRIDGKKVPYQVVLMVAELMDVTGLDEEELRLGLGMGLFDGKVVGRVNAKVQDEAKEEVEPEVEEKDEVKPELDRERIKEIIADIEKECPGAKERAKKARAVLSILCDEEDVDKRIIEISYNHLKGIGFDVTLAEVEEVYKIIMNN